METETNHSCEKLNVQFTEFIQDNGFFIAFDPKNFNVQYVSENCKILFHKNFSKIIGSNLNSYFSEKSILKIKKHIQFNEKYLTKSRVIIDLELIKTDHPQKQKDCVIYSSENFLCIEFQINAPDPNINENIIDTSIDFILQDIYFFTGSKEELAARVCQYVREITHFDRTYYCEFEEDGHGYVLADDSKNTIESILHHHFPATDLPMVVRKLYLKNRFRFIQDINYKEVLIKGLNQQLDLSFSMFRSIGKTHLKYLKNMGFYSSASFSVVEIDLLRGLIGCHSKKTKSINLKDLHKTQLIVEAFANKLLSYKLENTNSIKPNIELNIVEFTKKYEQANCNISKISSDSLQ